MLKHMLMLLPGVAVLLLAPMSGSAGADDPLTCTAPEQVTITESGYSCTIPGEPADPVTPVVGDEGGGGEPVASTCDLSGVYTYCLGTSPCVDVEWHPPMALPDGPKPQQDSEPLARECGPGSGSQTPVGLSYYWSDEDEPQPPSLAEQAQTAVGNLDLVMPELSTSPPGRTVVNFPTWYWLEDGAPTVTGSSAFGLVAIATAQEVRVDPGDGSGGFTCPWTTSAEQAEQSCAYTYLRASYDGSATWEGRPAHEASVRAAWTVRFEVDGTPVVIPEAPTTLAGPSSTAVVRVDEVQSLVSRTD